MKNKIGININRYLADVPNLLNLGTCEITREKNAVYPSVFINGEQRSVLPDTKIGDYYSFVNIQDGWELRNDIFTGNVEITIFAHTGKVGKNRQLIREEIINSVSAFFRPYSIIINEDPNNVYNGYTHKVEHAQFNMNPYYVLKLTVNNFNTICQ